MHHVPISSTFRVRPLVYAAFLVASLASPLSGQSPPPAPHFPEELDAYIAKAVKDWPIPGLAIAIVRGDTLIVAKGYGVRELGKPGKVDQNTVFDAASLAKSFTAMAVAMLVDSGRVRWDDPVQRHLPALRLPNAYLTENITLRDLLAHRSGLEPANFMWRFTGIDRAEAIRRMRHLRPVAPVRTQLVYSNIGYALAGEAVAAAAGTSWEAFMRDRIIRPLGMQSTVAEFAAVGRMPNHATPHAMLNGVQRPIRREGIARDAIAAAGSIQSTAADLARWMQFHLGDGTWRGTRLVSEAAMREMHSPQLIIPTTPAMRKARQVTFFAAYGLGWQVMDYRGHPMLWHTGGGDGQLAYMALLPGERIGVAILVNSWISPFIHGALAARILDTYLGVTPLSDANAESLAGRDAQLERQRLARKAQLDSVVPGSVPPRPLSSYAGVYADSLYGDLTVRVERTGLVLQMGRGESADLTHRAADTFLVRWRDPLFEELYLTNATFTVPPTGKAHSLTMRLNRDTVSVRRASGN